jgi:hypothetical protein
MPEIPLLEVLVAEVAQKSESSLGLPTYPLLLLLLYLLPLYLMRLAEMLLSEPISRDLVAVQVRRWVTQPIQAEEAVVVLERLVKQGRAELILLAALPLSQQGLAEPVVPEQVG